MTIPRKYFKLFIVLSSVVIGLLESLILLRNVHGACVATLCTTISVIAFVLLKRTVEPYHLFVVPGIGLSFALAIKNQAEPFDLFVLGITQSVILALLITLVDLLAGFLDRYFHK